MPMNPVSLDPEHTLDGIEEVLQNLDRHGAELVLDLSSVRRIDAGALRAMEKLAAVADEKAVKVVLSGVNIDVYKVLKLMNLAPRFSFV
jgi:anti-anti-sigma regulatory factor